MTISRFEFSETFVCIMRNYIMRIPATKRRISNLRASTNEALPPQHPNSHSFNFPFPLVWHKTDEQIASFSSSAACHRGSSRIRRSSDRTSHKWKSRRDFSFCTVDGSCQFSSLFGFAGRYMREMVRTGLRDVRPSAG